MLLGILLAALTSCGGGGSHGGASAVPAAVKKAPVGYGTLTIKFPAAFRRSRRKAGEKRRRPAYVNPTSGFVLDIYIDGVEVYNLDGATYSDSVTVQPTSDGTQTVTVPFTSANQDLAVVELDPCDNNAVVAVGEQPNVAVTPGQTTSLTLQMLMNVTGFAAGSLSDGSDAIQMSGGFNSIGTPGVQTPVYVYPTDPSRGFNGAVPATGVGGIPTNLTLAAAANDTSRLQRSLLGTSVVQYAAATSELYVTATATNPAYAIETDPTDYPWLSQHLEVFGSNPPLQTAVSTAFLVPVNATLPPTPTQAMVYVANRDTGVLGFPVEDNGNFAPTVNISGPNTQLFNPVALGVNPNGALWAANDSAHTYVVFAAGANGNAAPGFSGSVGTPFSTEGLAVDGNSRLYIASYSPPAVQTPFGAITSPGMIEPIRIALDGNGNLYVADSGAAAVEEFPFGVSGSVTPSAVISGAATGLNSPQGIAIDPTGRIVVADSGGSGAILVFSAGANGNVSPLQTITGAATGLSRPAGVTTDSTGAIWVADAVANKILRFASDAKGNSAPLQTISGPATLLGDPQSIVVF